MPYCKHVLWLELLVRREYVPDVTLYYTSLDKK